MHQNAAEGCLYIRFFVNWKLREYTYKNTFCFLFSLSLFCFGHTNGSIEEAEVYTQPYSYHIGLPVFGSLSAADSVSASSCTVSFIGLLPMFLDSFMTADTLL